MIPLLIAVIVGLAAAGIFALRPVTTKIKTVFHSNRVVNTQIKFQSLQLVLAAVVLFLIYLINPENFAHFFRLGNVNAHISKIAWLGVSGNETWLEIATSIGLFITLGTAIFMFFQLKKAGIFSVSIVILISGVVFGAPHYFGMPSGVVGALMAGFLGWLLAMSLVETQGLFLAWTIHFVQDVVIITSMILMSRKPDSAPV